VKVFVGNLALETAEQDLLKAFQRFGQVDLVNIAKHSEDGASRGFGFVDLTTDVSGHAAIAGLNGTPLFGKRLKVSEARRKESR
jgi:RNA recognition motif-containing protein